MIEWKEREHEAEELAAFHDCPSILALKNCGLLKLFKTHYMHCQARLLEYLIGKWDPEIRAFLIGVHTLEIELEDLYFIMGLSKRGAPVVMSGHRNVEETTTDYISTHYVAGMSKTSGKIPIKAVVNMPLCTIIFTIARTFGSTGSHHAMKAQMTYAIECTEPRVFNWCEGLLTNLRDQLTRCRAGEQKQFGYGSILVSFFLEWVPHLHPQIELPVRPVSEPQIVLWASLAGRLSRPQRLHFEAGFFQWLCR